VAGEKRHDPVLLTQWIGSEDEGVRDAMAHEVIMMTGESGGPVPGARFQEAPTKTKKQAPDTVLLLNK
ncbi:MAG TPA: hypothetical protein VK416_02415, partial [Thermoanaerobaculia bacterium]|nr:hypothetical protein [Thermoanaerobaculia bacterium]